MKKYNLKIENGEVSKEILGKVFEDRANVIICDEKDVVNEKLTAITNFYIKDCYKDVNDRLWCNVYSDNKDSFVECVSEIIKNTLYYRSRKFYNDESDFDNYHLMAVLKGNFYCKVLLPKDRLSKEKVAEYIGLGPDYLIGSLFPNEVFHYVLANLLYELYDEELLEDETYNTLEGYRIGLY